MVSLFRVGDLPGGAQGRRESKQPMALSPGPGDGHVEDRPAASALLPVAIEGGSQRVTAGWPPISAATAMLRIPSFAETGARKSSARSMFQIRRTREFSLGGTESNETRERVEGDEVPA